MAFSIKRNVALLMDRDETSSRKDLHMVYGLRFYNVCYIVTDHRLAVFLAAAVFNSQRFEEILHSWHNTILPHGDLFVDTFFFIGGLLASTILLGVFKDRFVNPFLLILYRFAR